MAELGALFVLRSTNSRKFIKKFRYQFDPYPNIGQFITAIREETPEDLQYLITDTFEKITLYENKARLANAFENPDGSYTLNLEGEAKKSVF